MDEAEWLDLVDEETECVVSFLVGVLRIEGEGDELVREDGLVASAEIGDSVTRLASYGGRIERERERENGGGRGRGGRSGSGNE